MDFSKDRILNVMGFPDGSVVKNPPMLETRVQTLSREDPWKRE